eukprot:3466688-Prymnesium_polylepis.1
MPGPSQPGGQLAVATSGRQTRPHAPAARPGRVAAAPNDWLAARPSALEQGQVVEVQRTPRDGESPHQNNQSFLLRFD